MTITANDLTFGIEIETHVSRESNHRPSGYRRTNDYATRLPKFGNGSWMMTTDVTIACPSGRTDCEFVSPILKGADGLRNVMTAVQKMREETPDGCGAKVNYSCGIHVHVQFPTNDLKALRRLVHLVAAFEGGLYAASGTKSREQSRWCRSIKETHKGINGNKSNLREVINDSGVSLNHRYVSLNLVPFIAGTRPTVEFRCFSGSLNETKIAGYVQMCIGMVEMALSMKSVAHWDSGLAGPTYGKDAGPGEREFNRLMKRLGWSGLMNKRSTADRGILTDETGDLPTKRRMLNKMRAMARKYDAA